MGVGNVGSGFFGANRAPEQGSWALNYILDHPGLSKSSPAEDAPCLLWELNDIRSTKPKGISVCADSVLDNSVGLREQDEQPSAWYSAEVVRGCGRAACTMQCRLRINHDGMIVSAELVTNPDQVTDCPPRFPDPTQI